MFLRSFPAPFPFISSLTFLVILLSAIHLFRPVRLVSVTERAAIIVIARTVVVDLAFIMAFISSLACATIIRAMGLPIIMLIIDSTRMNCVFFLC